MDPCVQSFLDQFSAETENLVRSLARFNQLAVDKQVSNWDPPQPGGRCGEYEEYEMQYEQPGGGGCCGQDNGSSKYGQRQSQQGGGFCGQDNGSSKYGQRQSQQGGGFCGQDSSSKYGQRQSQGGGFCGQDNGNSKYGQMQNKPQPFKSLGGGGGCCGGGGGCGGGGCGGGQNDTFSSSRPQSAQSNCSSGSSYKAKPNPCNAIPANLHGVSLEHYLKYHNPNKGCGSGYCGFCGAESDAQNYGGHHDCPGEIAAAGGFKDTEEHIQSFAQRFSETERTLRTLRAKLEDLDYACKGNPVCGGGGGGVQRQSPMPTRGNCQQPQCQYSNNQYATGGGSLIGLPRMRLPNVPPITRSRNPNPIKEYEMSFTNIPIMPSQRIPVIPGTFVGQMSSYGCREPSRQRVSFCD